MEAQLFNLSGAASLGGEAGAQEEHVVGKYYSPRVFYWSIQSARNLIKFPGSVFANFYCI